MLPISHTLVVSDDLPRRDQIVTATDRRAVQLAKAIAHLRPATKVVARTLLEMLAAKRS